MPHPRTVHGVLLAMVLGFAACADGAAKAYEAGIEKWDGGQYAEAIATLRVITRNHPDSPYAPRALLKVAQIQAYDLREPDEAYETFQLYLKLYPQSGEAAKALEELTTVLFEKKHDYLRTINECQRYLDSYPMSGKGALMQRRIVSSYLQLRDYQQARVEAGLFLRKYPQDDQAEEVAYEVARSYFIEGKQDLAVAETRKLLSAYPQGKFTARTRFLLAAALEEADRLPEALEAYRAARNGHPEPSVVDGKINAVSERLARKHK